MILATCCECPQHCTGLLLEALLCLLGDIIDQKLYRRQIVSVMLRHSFKEETAEIVPQTYRVPNKVRLDGYGHYPEPGPVRKCAVCKINYRNICGKCQQSVKVL